MKILLSDHDYPDLELERALFRAAGIELVEGRCRSEDEVIAAAKGCFGILLQYAPITDRVMKALPELAIVSRYGAGYDTIDTGAALANGVWVANSPDYGMGEVATHALGMALALVRHLPWYDRDVRAGTWHFESVGKLRRCSEMTLGIVGLGRIGKRMAHLSRNAFKRVLAFDPYLIDGDFPAYVERAWSLEELAEASDVLTLHVPLTDETRGMIDRRLLERMPQGGFLVNTARGAVVRIDELVEVLRTGRLGGAALDVLPVEPVPPGHPLLEHPRVLLTPHSAFYSVEAERELRRKAAQNLATFARTGRPDYAVVRGTRGVPRTTNAN